MAFSEIALLAVLICISGYGLYTSIKVEHILHKQEDKEVLVETKKDKFRDFRDENGLLIGRKRK